MSVAGADCYDDGEDGTGGDESGVMAAPGVDSGADGCGVLVRHWTVECRC
jgi:hypothetical protein